jgi:hypothetical protein
MKRLTALVATVTTLPALAHEGHGLFGSHWHATDALGFVGVAALIGFAIWMSRK